MTSGKMAMSLKAIAVAALLSASAVLPAEAQTIIDMSVISCDQFLKSPPEVKDMLSAWMGGYFSATKNVAKIDARYVARNSAKVTAYCKRAKTETVMSAIQRTWR
jgi:acid stress chaperone HdeB